MKRQSARTKRLEIRPFRASDYAAWAWIQLNVTPARTKYDRGPKKPAQCTLAVFKDMREHHEKQAKLDRIYVWGVFERASGKLVGLVDFFVICRDRYQAANLGYRIYNLYWERGFGREAVTAAMRMVFRDLKLHRLEASIDPDNPRSIALAKSLKMQDEGTRKRYYFQDGGWADQRIFSMTPELLGMRPHPAKL